MPRDPRVARFATTVANAYLAPASRRYPRRSRARSSAYRGRAVARRHRADRAPRTRACASCCPVPRRDCAPRSTPRACGHSSGAHARRRRHRPRTSRCSARARPAATARRDGARAEWAACPCCCRRSTHTIGAGGGLIARVDEGGCCASVPRARAPILACVLRLRRPGDRDRRLVVLGRIPLTRSPGGALALDRRGGARRRWRSSVKALKPCDPEAAAVGVSRDRGRASLRCGARVGRANPDPIARLRVIVVAWRGAAASRARGSFGARARWPSRRSRFGALARSRGGRCAARRGAACCRLPASPLRSSASSAVSSARCLASWRRPNAAGDAVRHVEATLPRPGCNEIELAERGERTHRAAAFHRRAPAALRLSRI